MLLESSAYQKSKVEKVSHLRLGRTSSFQWSSPWSCLPLCAEIHPPAKMRHNQSESLPHDLFSFQTTSTIESATAAKWPARSFIQQKESPQLQPPQTGPSGRWFTVIKWSPTQVDSNSKLVLLEDVENKATIQLAVSNKCKCGEANYTISWCKWPRWRSYWCILLG